ncbi:uncharacterized protein J7T54_008312 [Emericellopsis cladophorae]|uniref:Zn(2)-C6 fungal-type domain-containing protein n=1 Tax=Emericellopsis cladophorae TaxID=2686198 RepID=A0A9P9XUS7_9HYPO|nr:uncharacterized protein J7T54_008312 [Emericellopsis cladophorae]KAI6777978.1 hypothetical protein J7T54_008312 [Emericellopsis cladophorae]
MTEDANKRKRDADDQGQTKPLPPIVPQNQQGHGTGFINYLTRSTTERLFLLPNDPEPFFEILRIIGSYEGVLERQESLALSLGAKLHGPRLARGFESFFDGPIKTNPPQQPFGSSAVTWHNVYSFSRTNPEEFVLATLPDGTRCCQFNWKNGVQVEISEDDWRLIMSGFLSRIPLEDPLEEDEAAELETLDLLEQRASMLWRRADDVAARSRILHHKLGQRRQDIMRRRPQADEASSRFQSINQTSRPPSRGPAPYDLRADLLQQFLSPPTPTTASRSTSGAGLSQGLSSPALSSAAPQRVPAATRSPSTIAADEVPVDTLRPLITQKIDKLHRGDPISPACDRCRRLKLQCLKHLTACQGCTKKHAKCSWRQVTEDEIARLKSDVGFVEEGESSWLLHSPPPGSNSVGAPGIGVSSRIELPPINKIRASLPHGLGLSKEDSGGAQPPGPSFGERFGRPRPPSR